MFKKINHVQQIKPNNKIALYLHQFLCKRQDLIFIPDIANELSIHLQNEKFIQNEFFIYPENNEFNRFFYKFFISDHLIMIEKKFQQLQLDQEYIYFHKYFLNVILPYLYEQKIYKNLYFSEFRNYFISEFNKIHFINSQQYPEHIQFTKFLNNKLTRYTKSHHALIQSLTQDQFLFQPIEYGLIKKINQFIMDIHTFALLTSLFIYAFIWQKSLFYLYISLLVFYTIISIITSLKSNQTLTDKMATIFFGDLGCPIIHAFKKVKIDNVLEIMEKHNEQNPEQKITMTSVVAKIIGRMYQDIGCYGTITFGNFIEDKSIDLAIAVDIEGKNLMSMNVKNVGQRSITDISTEIRTRAKKFKSRQDKKMENTFKTAKLLPYCMIKIMSDILGFISYDLELQIPGLIKKKNFGHIILTNVQAFKLNKFCGPPMRFMRCLAVYAIGPTLDELVVEDGKIVNRKTLTMTILQDHRVIDGANSVEMFSRVQNVLDNFEKYI